ncbi:hypothetical protein CR513_13446, partial [Mucuna pruriens]
MGPRLTPPTTLKESSALVNMASYEWLSGEVEAYPSQFCTQGVVAKLVREVSLMPVEYVDLFLVEPYVASERVFIRAREGEPNFIYLYETILQDLWVTLSFDAFEVDVPASCIPMGAQPCWPFE